jgi:hypothetical protein
MYSDFTIYHELMARKVRDILLVSSPYDAFIMEEGESLAARIIEEYQGLNLSEPPRLRRVSTATEALDYLKEKKCDLVITTPHVGEMDAWCLGREIKKINSEIPIVLLAHSEQSVKSDPAMLSCEEIDHYFIWTADPDLMMAIIKNVEDRLNVAADTEKARVRVLIIVEDNPEYRSFLLSIIYREVVSQTQKILADSLNYEHKLLKMRARPKILVAQNFEDAFQLYERFKPYVFGVISDGIFPRFGKLDKGAGLNFLRRIRKEIHDLPLLMASNESSIRKRVLRIPAVFVDKKSSFFSEEIHHFLLNQLGFGDFVFRMPNGDVVGWASDFRTFEEKIKTIPEESFMYHANRNHFSNWIMARSEIEMASSLHLLDSSDFSGPDAMRSFLVEKIHSLRKARQKGIIAGFSSKHFDSDVMDFVKIGKGSLGGKGRGLAFMAGQLAMAGHLAEIPGLKVQFPQTLVIGSDGFDDFVDTNNLSRVRTHKDENIASAFLQGDMPVSLETELKEYLSSLTGPLSVRSSSLMEDAQFTPYAGLFSTYMLPNNNPDFSIRFAQFVSAIKLVYASTWFSAPRVFSGGQYRQSQEKMAVIVQKMVGSQYGDFFYPAVSGVAQSHNYYPVSPMKSEEGLASIALGFGRTVVEGEKSLPFSPNYPRILPHFSTVDDILENAQRYFYALNMSVESRAIHFDPLGNLIRREISSAEDEFPVRVLSSSYIVDEHRIRDGSHPGSKIVTFAQLLKYNLIPLPEVIAEFLKLGRQGLGCPVEIEFAVDIQPDPSDSVFYFLQIRPMVVGGERFDVEISSKEEKQSFCLSNQALGHGKLDHITDIIYIRPESFETRSTRDIAREISQLNSLLQKEKRSYLLIGPGRWGSADPWLGIPVQWQDISGAGAIVELRNDMLKVDPSQGSHFFHNITSLGIPYVTVTEGKDVLDWKMLAAISPVQETAFLRHIRFAEPFIIKTDASKTKCVMFTGP